VNINGSSTQANITTLAPMQTHVVTIPHNLSDKLNVSGTVSLSSGQTDQRPENNSISQQIIPAP
jgi:hypothetical protein